jgi:hypothetical protein
MSITSQYRKMYENKVLNEGETYDAVNTVITNFKDALILFLRSPKLNDELKDELKVLTDLSGSLIGPTSTLNKLRTEPETAEID